MSNTRVKLKIDRPRCPYCHGDIIPGEDNTACHECLAWHHSACWADHGSCVGCGNERPALRPTVPQNSPDPARFSIDVDCSPEDDCFVHDRMNERAKQDLFRKHGVAANKILSSMCKRSPENELAFLAKHERKLSQAENIAASKEHEAILRAERGPKKEPECNHKFSPEDYQCVYCRQDAGDVYDESFVDSLIDKQINEEYWNETVVCQGQHCGEPTTRRDMFCSMCLAEVEIWGVPMAVPHKTMEERRQDYEAYLSRRSKRKDINALIGIMIIVVSILVFLYSLFQH